MPPEAAIARPWKTVGSVVADGMSVLGALVRRANELGRCEESLEGCLGMHGAERLRVAAIEDGALVVLVDSAAWSAKLRFLAPRIVARVAQALGRASLERIDVRVRPIKRANGSGRRPARIGPERGDVRPRTGPFA